MNRRKGLLKRVIATLLAFSLVVGNLDLIALAADPANGGSAKQVIVADPGTAHTFETILGTDKDGNRYAGRLWVDKSVYTDGDTAILNTTDEASEAEFKVNLQEDEDFQVIFSVLGSSMTTTTTKSSTGPMDVVLILDNSISMNETSNRVTRMQRVIEAANGLISDLLSNTDVRLGITSYSQSARTIVPFDKYTNGVSLTVNNYSSGGVIYARDKSNNLIGQSDGYQTATNTQAGYDMAMRMLESASNTAGRTPVVILLTDGAANTAVDKSFYDISKGTTRQEYSTTTIDPGIVLSTLLGAAYKKASVAEHYGKAPVVYGIGVDLSSTDGSNAIINPKDGFNSSNSNQNVKTAYDHYTNTWLKGNTVTIQKRGYSFSFDHNYPAGSTIGDDNVAANINYVDNYHNVTSAGLEDAFTQIYEELTSTAFNPITSSSTVEGETGVAGTPLIYVDNIGKFMEVKEMQAITLFGSSYGVTKTGEDANGIYYTVQRSTGYNPTTNEAYDTSRDILISVTKDAEGFQKLEIRINQEILPILLEKVIDKTVGNTSTVTITELLQRPLRVYYTVGLNEDILLPNGDIDIAKVHEKDNTYLEKHYKNGKISFYSNEFGVMNKADVDKDGFVDYGDAHVGFKPSPENRYYYHPANQGVYTSVKRKDNVPIQWEAGEYGVLYQKNTFDFEQLSYENHQTYSKMADDTDVYTYVTFYRPVTNTADKTNAEKVSYIVYTKWGYLKESIAFYDMKENTYINYKAEGDTYTTGEVGYTMPKDKIQAVLQAYKSANPNADIKAMLGVGSLRTSRFHNMIMEKTENESGTAQVRYAPEYTYERASDHHENDVVVWLGNNGKLTVDVDTGIALTKQVTEAIGGANDTYALTVTIPQGVTATPVVKDANGNDVTATISTYSNRVLTVNVKAGETVYISGIPEGTRCTIGEIIPETAEYKVSTKTDAVTIPTVEEVQKGTAQYVAATVTNTPNKYGNLYITKEINSDHNIPESILNQEFAVEVNVGTALKGKEYTIKDSALTSNYKATVDNDGLLKFNIKARQRIEILDLPAETPVTVTEILTNAQSGLFKVEYRTRNYTGQDADNDNQVVIAAGGNATAVINNQYTPKPVSVNLNIAGTKNFEAESGAQLNGGTFNFKVQRAEWNANGQKWEWKDIAGKTAQAEYAPNEDGKKNFAINNVLEDISYTEEGSYAYQVLEVKGEIPNLTYDRTLYTFTVTVTDNGGQLVAKVTDLNNAEIAGGSYAVTFNNTYHTAPVSLDIVKEVKNETGDTTVSKAGFEFEAVRTDANWQPLTGNEASSLKVATDATGEARFAATYTDAGEYYYTVSEVNGGTIDKGWTYSKAVYCMKVTVADDDGDGNLTATMEIEDKDGSTVAGESASVSASGNTGKITFVNTYAPKVAVVDLNGLVKKSLNGKVLEDNEFDFAVYKNNSTTEIVARGTNDKDGNVKFTTPLTFNQIGKYEFDIREVENADPGIKYDKTAFDLVVEVWNDIATGELKAIYYFENSTENIVTFRNTYTVISTDYVLGGVKKLNGRAVKAGEFNFALYKDGEATPIETVANKADGTFTFSKINYDEAGTYTYVIKEVNGNLKGVTYNGVNNPVTVVVTVFENGVNNENAVLLSASADKANAEIIFENEYKAAPASVTFAGTKTFKGGNLSDGIFAFNLYETDHTFSITNANATKSQWVRNVGNAIPFEKITYETAGTHFYVVVEDTSAMMEDVVYDNTEYYFQVQVRDNGNGDLLVTVINANTGLATEPKADITIDTSFVNATFDEAVEKEVYLKDNVTTNIDGAEVKADDELTYFITYTNHTGKEVEVDIVDSIPTHTSYVEGSVSHNGTYSGGIVNWIMNVPKGESVTVSFKVTVDDAQATITNIAVVRDGVNVYHTNEVVNHSAKEEEKPTTPTTPTPTVPTPSEPTAPKTGDSTSVGMWSTLTFASLMACGALLIIEKKRKDEI